MLLNLGGSVSRAHILLVGAANAARVRPKVLNLAYMATASAFHVAQLDGFLWLFVSDSLAGVHLHEGLLGHRRQLAHALLALMSMLLDAGAAASLSHWIRCVSGDSDAHHLNGRSRAGWHLIISLGALRGGLLETTCVASSTICIDDILTMTRVDSRCSGSSRLA